MGVSVCPPPPPSPQPVPQAEAWQGSGQCLTVQAHLALRLDTKIRSPSQAVTGVTLIQSRGPSVIKPFIERPVPIRSPKRNSFPRNELKYLSQRLSDVCLDVWPDGVAQLYYHKEFLFICVCHVLSILASTSTKSLKLHDNPLREVWLFPHFLSCYIASVMSDSS